MDEEHLDRACELVAQERYVEAYREFIQLAENTADPLEKAWPLLYAVNTLQTLEQDEAATNQLSSVRKLIEKHRTPDSAKDENFVAAEIFLDFVDATILWRRKGSEMEVLARFDAVLHKHEQALKNERTRGLYEGIQIRRAFVLANLGHWKDALPILESVKSPEEYEEGVAFYLGHCYVQAGEYGKAKPHLVESLDLGLPPHLEYRARFELGIVYMALGGYARAKIEFEKALQTADAEYLKNGSVWKRLEICCRQLGLQEEAEQYARMK
jgi:tetratricopeptide (TPR) repeat protein